MESRSINAGKNALMQFFLTTISIMIGLVSRYLFNKVLGKNYLGLSNLFSTILGVLSFVDLGIGGIFSVCLYKPIAEDDNEYIEVLLFYLRRFIRIIVVLILLFAIVIIPFLRFFAQGAEAIDNKHLYFYYFLSIIETLVGYLCTYQVCYISAIQKEYKIVPIRIFGGLIIGIIKIIVLVSIRSYSLYVSAGTILTVFQQIAIKLYIEKNYSIVKRIHNGNIRLEDEKTIKRNVLASVVFKFANLSVNQTDAIIISTFLKIGTLGMVSNYTVIKGYVFNLVSSLQTSVYSGLGNVIATENKEKQLSVFYKYYMITQLIVSFAGCMLVGLMTPFIVLLFGKTWEVDDYSIYLMIISTMIVYHSYAVNAISTVHGRNDIVAKFAFIEGIVNLIVSIVAISIIGLPGVFLGTLVAEIVYFLIEPSYIMNYFYKDNRTIYLRTLKGFFGSFIVMFFLYGYKEYMFDMTKWGDFLLYGLLSVATWFVITIVIFYRDKYFRSVLEMAWMMVKRIKNK